MSPNPDGRFREEFIRRNEFVRIAEPGELPRPDYHFPVHEQHQTCSEQFIPTFTRIEFGGTHQGFKERPDLEFPWKPEDTVPFIDVLRWAHAHDLHIEVEVAPNGMGEQFIGTKPMGTGWRLTSPFNGITYKSFSQWLRNNPQAKRVESFAEALAIIAEDDE